MGRGVGAIRLPTLLSWFLIPSIDFPMPEKTHAGCRAAARVVGCSPGSVLFELLRWQVPAPERAPEILALDEALNKLAALDERQSKIVEMRFFAGMSEDEAGVALGISARTVKRDWRVAKAWLFKELSC
jgi:RNA polymerase sigma factor (sigma-70 family)